MKKFKPYRAVTLGMRRMFREQNKFKRQTYFWASLLSLPVIVWTWLLRFDLPVWRFSYGILLIGLIISLLALLNPNLPLRWVERFILIVVTVVGFIKYVYLLSDPAALQLTNWLGEIQATFWNFGLGFILIYIVFERKKAFWICTAQILLILTITLPHLGGFSDEILREFFRLETRLVAAAFLTLILAKAKDDLLETQNRVLDVETLAYLDPLTNLLNRRAFSQLMQSHLATNNLQIGLVLADVDFFKSINDAYGHEIGDETLRETAALLKASLRESDLVGRWGGEEFIIMLQQGDLLKHIQTIERIRQQFANSPLPNGLKITLSFGGSNFQKGDTFESLFSRADQALYVAKNKGRNRVEWL